MELMLCILSAIFACAVFVVNWLYNKPKDEQTKALRDTVVELKEVVETLRDYAVANKVEIAKIDESAKSSHKRLDDIVERLHEVEQRCVNCTCRKV
ncbi:MAG: hypothetical protein IIX53_02005 [Phascolarctobacterium sp.]|nr:hypothetical protein [Phascolarctobacterium sp.]MBQ5672657.1 hypothetical protein [Phascolarctobacterium sp.]